MKDKLSIKLISPKMSLRPMDYLMEYKIINNHFNIP